MTVTSNLEYWVTFLITVDYQEKHPRIVNCMSVNALHSMLLNQTVANIICYLKSF